MPETVTRTGKQIFFLIFIFLVQDRKRAGRCAEDALVYANVEKPPGTSPCGYRGRAVSGLA